MDWMAKGRSHLAPIQQSFQGRRRVQELGACGAGYWAPLRAKRKDWPMCVTIASHLAFSAATVLIYRLFEMRTFRGGPPSNRQAGGSGCLAGIDVSNAPSPELAKTVSYQGIPNLDGKVTLKVYAPYYQGKEPQTSTATPATPPSAGGTPPSASAGGAGGLVTCGSPGGGLLITTSVNTSCSINFAAALGVPVNLFSDMRLKGQPSHGTAFWSKWHADLYPPRAIADAIPSRCRGRSWALPMVKASTSGGTTQFRFSSGVAGRAA
jgi:hypothetical protein